MAAIAPFDVSAAVADLPPAVSVHGLTDVVTIRRDGLGIAHISGRSASDVFFGQGFATAQDRLWQLEWDRRRALGRSAELVGTPAMVVNDSFNRRCRLGDHARGGYAALDAATRAALDAHAAGINAFMASTSARPIEFQALECPDEPWEGWHAVAVFLIRHVTFSTWQQKLWNARVLAALGPDAVLRFRIEGSTGDTPLIVPPGVRDAVGALFDAGLFDGAAGAVLDSLEPLGLQQSGSNAWVVHGSRTATGSPMVAGDPHRPFEVHNVYYQVHLEAPGFDVAGFSFPGISGVQHFAQNEHVAWAVTNATADYQDLYVERLPDAILDTRVEVVKVRGGDDVQVECSVTRHGPVVVGDSQRRVGIALASTGLIEAGGSLRCILPLMSAHTVDELEAALDGWVEPANNFVMADAQGHIAYRTAGRIPVRHHLNSVLPVPGWTEAHDWSGTVPDAALPRARDPQVGAVVTANQRIAARDSAYVINYDAAPANRADRIWTRLGDRTDLTLDDHAAIHRDAVTIYGRELARRVVALGGPAADVLRDWDGTMDAGSAAAALNAHITQELCRLVVEGLPSSLRSNPFAEWEPPATAWPPVLRVAASIGGWLHADDTSLVGGRSWDELIVMAADRAVALLSESSGAEPSAWTWGAHHRAAPVHPAQGLDETLDQLVRPVSGPLSGGADCVMAMNQVAGVGTAAVSGSTARYVWDLGDRSRSGWIVPRGASGHPASPHWDDQLAAWSVGELLPVFDPGETGRVELRPTTAANPFTGGAS